MYKLVVFTAVLAVASAGYIGSPYGGLAAPYGGIAAPIATGWGHGVVSAPLLGAPIVKTAVPVATSYANTVKLAGPAVVAAHAPVVAAHAPLVAPAYGPVW